MTCRRRDRGRGRRRAAARRGAPRAARVRALRPARGLPLPLRQPDPARARARLERCRDRAGLVAGAAAAGRDDRRRDELLELGLPLEGHADNLAAALCGGVCLLWPKRRGPHAHRIAADLPLAPIVVVPAARTNTAASRNGLPATRDARGAAAHRRAAALLGAAIAAATRRCSRDALPRPAARAVPRSATRRCSTRCARTPPDGAVGVTLSGSGPSVVVWAEPDRVADGRRRARSAAPRRRHGAPARASPRQGARLA